MPVSRFVYYSKTKNSRGTEKTTVNGNKGANATLGGASTGEAFGPREVKLILRETKKGKMELLVIYPELEDSLTIKTVTQKGVAEFIISEYNQESPGEVIRTTTPANVWAPSGPNGGFPRILLPPLSPPIWDEVNDF